MEAIRNLRPRDANRVASRIAPNRPSPIRKFVGISMMPSVLESTKNNTNSLSDGRCAEPHMSVIRGLDRRIHLSSQEHDLKMMDCRVKHGNDIASYDSEQESPPHDASSPAIKPGDLPLGLLRSQTEARPHHGQRR